MVPATDSEITQVFMGVRRREPNFPNFAYGFLYATGSNRRRTVAIPYNYGVDKLQSIDDLFVHLWVPKPTVSSNVVDMNVGRVLASSLPNTLVSLEHSYFIIYVPPAGQVAHDVNACRALRSTSEWAGNILVVKHGKRKPVINVEKEDSTLVDLLVSANCDRHSWTATRFDYLVDILSSEIMGGQAQKKRKAIKQTAYDRKGKRMRVLYERTTASAHTFSMIPELFLELLCRCDLSTVMALAKLSRYGRDLVKSFYASNQRLMLAQFVGEADLALFYQVLETALSGMGGSFTSGLLTPPYNTTVTNNLNVLVPRGNMFMWRDFFDSINLGEHMDQPGVDRKFMHTTFSHVVYCAKTEGFTISLSESHDNSILTPLIGATTTLNTTLCTAAGFYSLYPGLLNQRRALEGWFPTPVRKAVAIGKRGYRSSFSTTSWQRPCGLACPVLWRQVRGLHDVGIFNWGGCNNQHSDSTDVGVPFHDTALKWRLGDVCTNVNCPSHRGNYFSVLSQ
ncbi:hypothetical protein C8F04DRAFT_1275125 [Mycena alexandri]|uniref:Uncharacterized protein n=1 Tax=Mycena alexandri TaxID=1745969 RepID=A0AAD6WTI5_9AGAR|nr:hypothetical protein C8F04DRAFT_1275125 [Mycena alexandri]